MSKRDIPEINAGSMADIAFLLLLFFLVTTTMDKDRAYLRDIPKKIDVPPPEFEIQKRNILKIEANSENQLKVRESFPEPSEISDIIIKFYRTSEKENHPEENYPLYSTATLEICNKKMDELEAQILLAEANDNGDLATFLLSAQDEWDKKKKAIELLIAQTGIRELREIDKQAHIKIVVQKATTYGVYTQIHNEIEEALNFLRNKRCKELFGESYTHMKFRYNQNRDENPEDKPKIDLIDILYPGKIIEVEPKN